jgi:hypothetical protein
MKKITSLVMVAALAFTASSALAYTTDPTPPSGHPAGHGWVQLSSYNYMTSGPYAGSYEYVYDLYNDSSTYLRQLSMDFDTSGVLNNIDGSLRHTWCAEAAGKPRAFGGGLDFDTYPSYWVTLPDFTQQWAQPKDILPTSYNSYVYSADARPTAPNQAWYTDNIWHDGGEYQGNGIWTFRDGAISDTNIYFNSDNGLFTGDRSSPGLALTFVIYHTSPVEAGSISFAINQGVSGVVDGPSAFVAVTGDFDGDGDVDADDVDILYANLGGDPGTYDLTDDGVVDQDDVDEWVFNIVPIGENIGTVYGDFNLDGEVNAGDLALLATNYGLAGTWGWATGDGNGDGNVDAGDLAQLATNYGTVVHTVPEPVTMSLLALGGVALLRRRK